MTRCSLSFSPCIYLERCKEMPSDRPLGLSDRSIDGSITTVRRIPDRTTWTLYFIFHVHEISSRSRRGTGGENDTPAGNTLSPNFQASQIHTPPARLVLESIQRQQTFHADYAFVCPFPCPDLRYLSAPCQTVPSCLAPSVSPRQAYNSGDGARLPYATECAVAEGTCDPAGLMEWLDNPGSAEVLDLDLPQDAESGDAVGEVRLIQVSSRLSR